MLSIASMMLVPGGIIPVHAVAGGPLVLMGIDAEDGAPSNAHGSQATYDALGVNVHTQVTNGAVGLLVFGCTSAGTDDVTFFWNSLATAMGEPLTCIETAAGIAAVSIPSGAGGFAMIGVASSSSGTPSGGLTDAESNALSLRQPAIAAHVNAGGGLLGFSQDGQTNPYGWLAGIGAFATTTGLLYDNITATPAGTAIGINNTLDVFAWHDVYNTFPSFLEVLANIDCSGSSSCNGVVGGEIAAIGGSQVVISGEGCTPGFWKNNSDKHDASAWETYSSGDDFDTTFGVDISINWSDKGKPKNIDDFSLQQALEAKGGGLNTLARHGTAALLNAVNGNIDGLTEAQVIQQVQDAVAAFDANDLDIFNEILDEITDKNEQVCPINQQGDIVQ